MRCNSVATDGWTAPAAASIIGASGVPQVASGGHAIIIRLLRGRVPKGQEGRLVERLRGLDETGSRVGFAGATFGFRRSGDELGFLALSTWELFEAISQATAGPPDGTIASQPAGETLDAVTIDLFEAADGPPLPVRELAGGALGMITASVAPHAEAAAHEMIRNVGPEVGAAGVAGLHIGRRVLAGRTELLVVASWRDRLALHVFAQNRASGTLDPAFLRLLTDWRFETYDCLGPGATALPAAGPAVLLADDDARYVDASPSIEAIIGVPAELVVRQTLADLTPPGHRADAAAQWAAFLADGRASGEFDLVRADGGLVRVQFRALADCPRAGIHASVIGPVGQPPDPRSVAEIVASVFPDAVEVAA